MSQGIVKKLRRIIRAPHQVDTVTFLISPVIETIHLFIDNIGTYTGSSQKDSRLFQYRRLDTPVSIQIRHLDSHPLNHAPVGLLIGQNIFEALQGLILFWHGCSFSSTSNTAWLL